MNRRGFLRSLAAAAAAVGMATVPAAASFRVVSAPTRLPRPSRRDILAHGVPLSAETVKDQCDFGFRHRFVVRVGDRMCYMVTRARDLDALPHRFQVLIPREDRP